MKESSDAKLMLFVCFRSFAVMANRAVFEFSKGQYLNAEGAPLLRSISESYASRPVVFLAVKVIFFIFIEMT